GRYVTVTGKGGGDRRSSTLGRWRWPALSFVAMYVLLAIVLPYGTILLGSFLRFLTPELSLSLFGLDQYASVSESDRLLSGFRNTAVYSVVTATLLVPFAAIVTYLITRSKSAVTASTDFIANIPLA